MKKLALTTIVLLTYFVVSAQQGVIQGQAFVNPAMVNPSLAALTDEWEVGIFTRNQWLAGGTSPNTQFFSLSGTKNKPMNYRARSGRIKLMRSNSTNNGRKAYHAFALTGINDQAGAFGRMDVQMHWSPQIRISRNVYAGVGPTIGLIRYQIDPTKVDFLTGSDETWSQYLQSGISNTGFTMNINGAIIMPQAFVGFSIYDPVKPLWVAGYDSETLISRRFGFNAGYDYFINTDWDVEAYASTIITPNAPIEVDGNIRINYSNSIWAGVAYRSYSAVSASVGFLAKNRVRFSYTLERSTALVGPYLGWSHELYLGILISQKSKAQF